MNIIRSKDEVFFDVIFSILIYFSSNFFNLIVRMFFFDFVSFLRSRFCDFCLIFYSLAGNASFALYRK